MSGLQEYVNGLAAPEGYKRLLLGVHGLSRRKRERFLALVRQEYEACEWGGPSVEDYDQWRARDLHARLVWFVAIGVAANHSVIVADNFYGQRRSLPLPARRACRGGVCQRRDGDSGMSAIPSTHPEAPALQARLAPVLAAVSEERDIRSLLELLGNHRGIGWATGEERVGYVQELHDALHSGGRRSAPLRRKIRKITYDDLLGAFGAGPWEPT